MTDRGKVIQDLLEACAYFKSSFDALYGTAACEKFRGWTDAIEQSIALLKEQEPVEPIFDYDGRDVWRCGNCHRNIFHPTRTDEDENEKNYRRFCFHCGRAVKWK